MTDKFDRATEIGDALREDAIQAQRRRANLDGKTAADSAFECSLCDEPIPEARRQALPGVHTCIDCQELIERSFMFTDLGET